MIREMKDVAIHRLYGILLLSVLLFVGGSRLRPLELGFRRVVGLFTVGRII